MAAPNLTYCAEQVRRFDPDRYLTVLFAPTARRPSLFALYAFNLEIAKTAEVVSEAPLGLLRLQWWRDILEAIEAGQESRHEVAEPLAEAVRRHGLDTALLGRLIDAREFDLERRAPDDLAALEAYAEETSADLVHLALQILGVDAAPAWTAGRHAGIAGALAGLLRAVPFHAAAKRLYLPRDLSEAAGLRIGDLFELRSSPPLCRVAERVAACAREHLRAARALSGQVPKAARPALLGAILAEQALARLARAGYDPFADGLRDPAPGRAWRLAWAAMRGRY
ncbi:MAG: phytoene/squalene synthase family protein [Alphaproteobacteria bacterium]|nr:phytoene/squalene synthase family protein [Alphaproteobacteria bacterium]